MRVMLLLLLSFSAIAGAPDHWSNSYALKDRHEFLKEGEPIVSPRETWQTLFSVAYFNQQLQLVKDCVYYRIPGDEGFLKIRTLSADVDCDSKILDQGDREISGLKEVEFRSGSANELELRLTPKKGKSETWEARAVPSRKGTAAPLISSAEFKGPKVILLGEGLPESPPEVKPLQGKCHDVADSCEELSPSRCKECPEGWYEVPNGCPQGPKFCGRLNCGGRNQPACRRGMKYQRSTEKLDCRMDSSFAYCAPDLIIQCEGSSAYCR